MVGTVCITFFLIFLSFLIIISIIYYSIINLPLIGHHLANISFLKSHTKKAKIEFCCYNIRACDFQNQSEPKKRKLPARYIFDKKIKKILLKKNRHYLLSCIIHYYYNLSIYLTSFIIITVHYKKKH